MATDKVISRHPLRKEILFILTTTEIDQYQDSILREEGRIQKYGIVQKNPDLIYVQSLSDELVDDGDAIPWIITTTVTGLPRNIKQDDLAIIDGSLYKVSQAKPRNRDNDSVLIICINPARNTLEDTIETIKGEYDI